MQKSKSRKILLQDAAPLNKPKNIYKWSLKQFEELYPVEPNI